MVTAYGGKEGFLASELGYNHDRLYCQTWLVPRTAHRRAAAVSPV